MNNSIKICAALPHIRPLNPAYNAGVAIKAINAVAKQKPDVVVLPPMFLTGGELGAMQNNTELLISCAKRVVELAKQFAKAEYTIIGGMHGKNGVEAFCIQHGRLLSGGTNTVNFEIRGVKISAYAGVDAVFKQPYRILSATPDILVVCDHTPCVAGYDSYIKDNFENISAHLNIPIFFVRGGEGDTSHPHVYRQLALAVENAVTDIAADVRAADFCHIFETVKSEQRTHVVEMPRLRPLEHERAAGRAPFIPRGLDEREYCLDVFSLQAKALADRLFNIGAKSAVLGLSGGLDSAMALLVCAAAADRISMPRTAIIAALMPGFGTSTRTGSNAEALAAAAGATAHVIDIKSAVSQMFKDIGHDEQNYNTVFENAQARQRTAVCLNLANATGGIMVGTGDMSEEALGFATFGGDTIASYNVNACLPKTLMRAVIRHAVTLPAFAACADIIADILDTPVSPELLPGDGEIVQKTEQLLAPYELLDFFLYCFVALDKSGEQIVALTLNTFGKMYPEKYIREKLNMFFTRFVQGQFKRSCAPECAAVTEVNLLQYSLPSDMRADLFLVEQAVPAYEELRPDYI